MTENLDEIREAVEQAQGKSVFDLVEAIKGRAYPTDEVTVYTNVDAAYELMALNSQMETIAQAADQDRDTYEALEKLAEDLTEEIKKSAITFHLRGISPGHIKKIMRKVDKHVKAEELSEDEASDFLEASYVAPHIIKTVNAEGAVEERLFSVDDVLTIMEYLSPGEFNKIDRAVQKLSFSSMLFDQATDAGFLPKS